MHVRAHRTHGPSGSPRPSLSLLDTVAIIVGIVIGAGIFETPPLVAANSSGSSAVLIAWLAGGLITLVGALCYAELASTYPDPGGNITYLRRAFGEFPAFLLGWSRLAVIQTGSIAMLGYIFGDYAAQVWAPAPHSAGIYAAVAVLALTAVNLAGIRLGKSTQNVLTLCTLAGLVLVIVGAFSLPAASAPLAPAAAPSAPAASGIGLMMIFVLLTYGGWSEAAYVSAEVKRRRDIIRALVFGSLVIAAVYVLVNVALLRALGLAELAQSKAVGAEILRRALGAPGAWLVALLVAVTALGSMNATVITGARTAYALGRDHALFSWLGRWDARANTPVNALVAQALIALALVGFGSFTRQGFKTMVEFTTPVFWLFLLLTAVSLMVLRRVDPDRPRPFKVPLYPFLPLVFTATSAYMLYASLAYTGAGALVGAGVLLAGIPLMWFSRRRATRPAPVVIEPIAPEEAA